ncbi:hypothetical protein [Mucilaginibacter aquatilis]|uniref:Uncharacterized protein n=1 Tax=Mucilaginibacter aquatilis TaxID=1517760 RepID=A0A6I4I9P2_9SPHI|nr:hypothetical protein [Mucilaginibacter aquatilis]MVN91920.1 hypothetical protein [Mucilaginibacter aquatilis]
MKKSIILIALLLPLAVLAQSPGFYVKPKEQFFTLFSTSYMGSTKCSIKVDFGSDKQLLKKFGNNIVDETSKVKEYDSLADALNYVSALGWEFVFAYPTTFEKKYFFSQYLFKRKVL